jgi:hypothetical protein
MEVPALQKLQIYDLLVLITRQVRESLEGNMDTLLIET